MAMAASDVSLLDARDAPLRVSVEELKPTPEGDLEIILQKWENHECVQKTIEAQKTEDPAVFTIDYHGERTLSVLDTDYSNHLIFCMGGPAPADERGTACQYLARTLKADDEVMEKFSKALEALPEHMQIQDLSQEEEQCHV